MTIEYARLRIVNDPELMRMVVGSKALDYVSRRKLYPHTKRRSSLAGRAFDRFWSGWCENAGWEGRFELALKTAGLDAKSSKHRSKVKSAFFLIFVDEYVKRRNLNRGESDA